MKICWDNLEEFKLGQRGGELRKGHYTYLEMPACVHCGQPYLMNKYVPTEFCSKSCGKLASGFKHSDATKNKIGKSMVGNKHMLGKTHSLKTKLKLSEITSSKCGPQASNWRGGISFEPYCSDWTKEYKEYIRERDGDTCLNPDCWCKDDVLTIHHINYDKKNCGPENLITVCRSCNSRANKDRRWHKAWYQAIINKRYGG